MGYRGCNLVVRIPSIEWVLSGYFAHLAASRHQLTWIWLGMLVAYYAAAFGLHLACDDPSGFESNYSYFHAQLR